MARESEDGLDDVDVLVDPVLCPVFVEGACELVAETLPKCAPVTAAAASKPVAPAPIETRLNNPLRVNFSMKMLSLQKVRYVSFIHKGTFYMITWDKRSLWLLLWTESKSVNSLSIQP